MPRLDDGAAPPKRIAVLRALQLGDLLCAVPALRSLRHAYPSAAITLIGLPWAAQFVRRFNHLLDAFVEFPGYPGLPEREPDFAAWPAFLYAAANANLDVAIQMHGRGDVTNGIAQMLGARKTFGFHPGAGHQCPDAECFTPWPENGTEVDRCLSLVDFLEIPRREPDLEFPIAAEEYATAHAMATSCGLAARRFVCVHPGARLRSRRWPMERFARITRELCESGYRVVVTGTADETPLCAAVSRGGGPHAIDLCGRTSLGVLAGLVSMARLVVCNDTGVSHVAAALGVPSVVVSCGADADRFAPADAERHRVLYADAVCRPCMYDECPVGHICATALDFDTVADAIFVQLARSADLAAHVPSPLSHAARAEHAPR